MTKSMQPRYNSSAGAAAQQRDVVGWMKRHGRSLRGNAPEPVFQLTDRLHQGRTARVDTEQVAATVSGWLAEFGASSPLVDDLAHAVRTGDWPKMYALGEYLSVRVAIAP